MEYSSWIDDAETQIPRQTEGEEKKPHYQLKMIHVANFPFLKSEEEATKILYDHFSSFGPVVSVKILSNSKLNSKTRNVCVRFFGIRRNSLRDHS